MNALELIAQDLFDKVRSRFSNLQMGGESGSVTVQPTEARFFDFDFVVEGNNLGRVSISINDVGTLKVYYSQGIVEDRDSITQGFWFDFLREMRQFAKRRMLRFDTRDITKGNLDKNDFAYLAQQGAQQQPAPTQVQQPVAQESNMTESSMYGSSKSSYRPLDKTLLIVRHNHKVGEDRGARSRSNNIQSIFIQNEAGERFKYPFVHMAGAKAMQRHVANGGTPFDTAGSAIIGMSEQINQLGKFKRQVGNVEQLTTEARGIVDRVGQKLSSLRSTMESIAKQTHYEAWRESLEEAHADLSDIDEATIEDYKSKFTVSSFKEDLTQYFPLLYKVMQETSTVDLDDYVGEAKDDACDDCGKDPCECEEDTKESMDAFEAWAEEVTEGPFEDAMEEGANKVDIPAYKRKASGDKDWKVTQKDLDAADEKNISSRAGLQKLKRDLKVEGYYIGAEDLPDWTRDALHRVSRGEVQDWTELYGELMNFIDDESKAERIAKLTFAKGGGVDSMAQHRVKAEPEMDVPKDDSEDDDDSFLNKLRAQARSGSIKPGLDTGEKESMEEPKGNPYKEIAEVVLSHFDRETGKFPLGETGVVVKISKEFGDRAGQLAEKLIQHLQSTHEAQTQMEAIRRLSGLPPLTEAEKKTMSRAAKGNEKYGKDGMKALAKAGRDGASEKKLDSIRNKFDKYDESTGDYSAKKAAAGKDLGKPGKNFAKIAKKSGGGEKGERIAGAVLAKLRKK